MTRRRRPPRQDFLDFSPDPNGSEPIRAPVFDARDPAPKTPRDPKPARAPRTPHDRQGARRGRALGLTVLLSVPLLILLSVAAIWWTFLRDIPALPPRELLLVANRAPAMKFYDRNGDLIASRGPRFGEVQRLDNLPRHVIQAFLAAEDRRFFQHGVLDLKGMGRASLANLKAGGVVQGGSTLTQQLAKSLFVKPEQTLKRKIQEAVIAWRITQMMNRTEVLETYLNRIYFGANSYGIDAAAHAYFGKPATALNLPEAAMLAALPKAPSRLSPHRDMIAALERSHLVLAAMREEGWITPQQEQLARGAPPKLVRQPGLNEGDFAWVLDHAAAEAVRLAGPDQPVLAVHLTVDPVLQLEASAIVRTAIAQNRGSSRASQASALVLAPDGAIRAMVGGVDYRESPFNRATQAQRQPGSTFKAFVYAAALERGTSPRETRTDSPLRIGGWRPKNYGGGYSGTVTLETALARSINTVAVKLGREVGAPAVAELATRFGIGGLPSDPNLTITLGSYETTLLDLTRAFHVFQQAGRRVEPTIIEAIDSADGTRLHTRPGLRMHQVYDPGKAADMVQMLQGVVARGTGQRAAFGPPIAGKTGTSQNWRDAWFVGFTPNFTGGVWVGNDDNRPMNNVTGGTLPALIWREIMISAHEGQPVAGFDWLPQRQAAPPVTQTANRPEAIRPEAIPDDEPRSSFVPRREPELRAPQPREWQPQIERPDPVPAAVSAAEDFGVPYDAGPPWRVIMPGEPEAALEVEMPAG